MIDKDSPPGTWEEHERFLQQRDKRLEMLADLNTILLERDALRSKVSELQKQIRELEIKFIERNHEYRNEGINDQTSFEEEAQ